MATHLCSRIGDPLQQRTRERSRPRCSARSDRTAPRHPRTGASRARSDRKPAQHGAVPVVQPLAPAWRWDGGSQPGDDQGRLGLQGTGWFETSSTWSSGSAAPGCRVRRSRALDRSWPPHAARRAEPERQESTPVPTPNVKREAGRPAVQQAARRLGHQVDGLPRHRRHPRGWMCWPCARRLARLLRHLCAPIRPCRLRSGQHAAWPSATPQASSQACTTSGARFRPGSGMNRRSRSQLPQHSHTQGLGLAVSQSLLQRWRAAFLLR